jgi:serine/threonine protein kinase/Tfp pilus assembly protein PilF
MTAPSVHQEVSLESLVAQVTDEFFARQKRGEQPDVEEYAARYPQYATVLREVLNALRVIDRSAASGSGLAGGDPASGLLGDFRIRREVGRGGMGVVYEAEQLSLGRRVALKVLPFAATLDPRQLQRFHNEARAAAGLHHTNIVPVYGVGCERGVHYYAMQFIEGSTLADLIAQQRGASSTVPPTAGARAAASEATVPAAAQATRVPPPDAAYFRRVAEWGIQAAAALDCAHALGVVHRDVKPANLLVDATGRLWVTDFGLAQVQSDPRLTMTGDLVGTLRYMSPEQALARRMVIDHRTDVYSLGATLYELLTLRAPFEGSDREELSRQIAFEEPRPPRRVNKAIPAELQIIVLKAMEKNPADRYVTAQELAEDLERFVADKPIRARRASLIQRARKWARRHRTIAWAAGVVLGVVIVALAASLTIVWHSWEQTRIALENEKSARQAERLAQGAQVAEAERAKDNLELAYRVLQDLHMELVGKRLGRDIPSRGSERELLQKALQFYEEFARRNAGHGLILQLQVAMANSRAGEIYYQLGSHQEAARAYDRALGLFESLTRAKPGDPILCREMGRAYHNRGVLLAHLGKSSEAIESVRRAIAGIKDRPGAFKDAKEHQRVLAQYRSTLAESLAEIPQREQAEEALEHCLGSYRTLIAEDPVRAEDVLEYVHALVVSIRLANAPGSLKKAEAAYQAGLTALTRVKGPAAAEPSYQRAKAGLKAAWAVFLATTGRESEAAQPLREALALDEALARKFPRVPQYRDWLASDYVNLGNIYASTKRYAEAESLFQKSVTESEKLVSDFPEVEKYRHALARTLYNLGHLMIVSGRAKQAAPVFREAIRRWPDFADGHFGLDWVLKNDPATKQSDAPEIVRLTEKALALGCKFPQVWLILSHAYCRTERWEDAVRALQKAREHVKDDNFSNEFLLLAMAHWHLGHKDEAIHWYREAVRAEKQRPLDRSIRAEVAALLKIDEPPKSPKEPQEALPLKKDSPEAHYNLGNALLRKSDLDGAIQEYREALRLNKDYPLAHLNLGVALAKKGDLDGAIQEYQEALRRKKDFPDAQYNLGVALRQQGRFAEARTAFRSAAERFAPSRPELAKRAEQNAHHCEGLIVLEKRLPALRAGTEQPRDNADRLALVEVCTLKRLYHQAVGFYEEAFASEPDLASDVKQGHRYNASCAAALAGCGKDKDAAGLDAKERARLHQQALVWLRADLTAWQKHLAKNPDQVRPLVVQQLRHWQQDSDFAGVRGPEALSKLPEAERQAWQQLWADVAETLARAQKETGPEEKSGTK